MIKLKINPLRISWTTLLFMCVGYVVIACMYENVELGSKIFTIAFIAASMCIFLGIICMRYIGVKDPFWLGLLIVIFAIMNVFVGSAGNRTLDYFAKVMRFDATIMLIYICTKYTIGKSVVHYFCLVNQILALALIYQGFVVKETYYIYTDLTLGFPNPNSGGIWSALCLCGMIWSFSCLKSKVIKLFYLIEIALLFHLLICTGCRSALLSMCGLIVVVMPVKSYIKRREIKILKKKLFRIIITMIYIFPLIFPVIYVGIFYAKIEFNKVAGKDFYSGRQVLWYRALLNLKSHYIIGAYNEVSLGTGQSQLHNIYIDVLCSYGIIVFSLFLLYILWIVLRQLRKLRTVQQYIAFFSFLMMFFIGGTFEAAYVTGSIGINYWVCIFLLFSNANRELSSHKYDNICVHKHKEKMV